MGLRLTKEKINIELLPRNIELVGEYQGNRVKTTFRCLLDNYTWESLPHTVRIQKKGCSRCYGNERLGINKINLVLEPRGIKIIGEYINAHTPTTFLCENNHKLVATVNNVIHNCTSCQECSNGKTTYIYVFNSIHGTKVGVSNNPHKRLSEIKRSSNFEDLYIFGIYSKGSRNECLQLEQHIHNCFKNFNCDYTMFSGATEFFFVTPETFESVLLYQGALKVQ